MSSFSVSYQYGGQMPKFQMVNKKRKNSNDCQLERMGISSSLLLFFRAAVQVKTTGGNLELYFNFIEFQNMTKLIININNLYLKNRKLHISLKANFQPRILKKLSWLTVVWTARRNEYDKKSLIPSAYLLFFQMWCIWSLSVVLTSWFAFSMKALELSHEILHPSCSYF